MSILDSITEDLIVLDLKEKSKSNILGELLEATITDNIKNQKDSIVEKLYKREEAGSTGLGKSLAIPHTQCNEVQSIEIRVGISKNGIEYGSLDGSDVNLFFLILVNPLEQGLHLQALSEISILSQDDSKLKAIINAKSKKEVIEIFKSA